MLRISFKGFKVINGSNIVYIFFFLCIIILLLWFPLALLLALPLAHGSYLLLILSNIIIRCFIFEIPEFEQILWICHTICIVSCIELANSVNFHRIPAHFFKLNFNSFVCAILITYIDINFIVTLMLFYHLTILCNQRCINSHKWHPFF